MSTAPKRLKTGPRGPILVHLHVRIVGRGGQGLLEEQRGDDADHSEDHLLKQLTMSYMLTSNDIYIYNVL